MRVQRIILFATLILFDSCIDVLDYSSSNDNQQLVVDGFITDSLDFAFRHASIEKPADWK